MKKVFLFSLAIMLATVTMNAQKLSWVGGALGFTSGTDATNVKTTSFSILPEVGFKLNDKFDLGLVVGYENVKTNTPVIGDATTSTFKVNPYLRYNLVQGKLAGLFLDGGVYYNSSKVDGADNSTNEFGIGITPGVKVPVSTNFTIIARMPNVIGYSNRKYGSVTDNRFDFGVNMTSLTLGIVYTL